MILRHRDGFLRVVWGPIYRLGRAFLRNPRWVWDAADILGGAAFCPPQFLRARTTPLPEPALRPHDLVAVMRSISQFSDPSGRP